MTTTKTLKICPHLNGWSVYVKETHCDARPDADWRQRIENTRTYQGPTLFVGTASECHKWIADNRKEVEVFETR